LWDFLNTFTRTNLVLQQVTLKRRNLEQRQLRMIELFQETHAQLILRDGICETLSKLRYLSLIKHWNGVAGHFTLRQRKVFLGGVNVFGLGQLCSWWCGGGTNGLGREKTLENALGLPFCGMRKVHPDIHAAWAAEGWIKTLNMVSRCKKETA
jgi:hypothetical protein